MLFVEIFSSVVLFAEVEHRHSEAEYYPEEKVYSVVIPVIICKTLHKEGAYAAKEAYRYGSVVSARGFADVRKDKA